jgi:hypothetical protein
MEQVQHWPFTDATPTQSRDDAVVSLGLARAAPVSQAILTGEAKG